MKVLSYGSLHVKSIYFPPDDKIAQTFFIPVLGETKSYDRSADYFTSSSLVEISVGLCSMASNGGKIRVITSPKLNIEDIEAIRKGYDAQKVYESSIVSNFKMPDDPHSLDRLSLLSELVSAGIMEFRIAVMRNLDEYPEAMFHAKFGIMYNMNGDVLAFSGSMNESANGMGGNWDHVSVEKDPENIKEYQSRFEKIWNGEDPLVLTLELPKVASDLIKGLYNGHPTSNLDKELLEKFDIKKESVYFKSPQWLKIRPYQRKAIEKWLEQGGNGIFNMATGTGKTKTALCALESLYNKNPQEAIYTIIVAPQKHLVDQWEEEVGTFGVPCITGHSDASSDWKARFRKSVLIFNSLHKNSCLVTTISSFSSKEVQDEIRKISNLALVIDEAHNMGSDNRLEKLPDNAKFRLALSATVDRYKDAIGTMRLKDYFGPECINLPIEEAIGKYLTNYNYHPIVCCYSNQEYERYVQRNVELNVVLRSTASKIEKQKAVEDYKLYCATLNASVETKFDNLVVILNNRKDDNHMLIYCGKTKVIGDGDFDHDSHEEGIRIIDKTSKLVGIGGVGLRISRVTYRESLKERRSIFKDFEDGEIDAIVAITCLDEGVDMPSIRTAFIMSSSDNPREYIQRRGRVLRQYPGKEHADIFDFIVLPKPLSEVDPFGSNVEIELRLLAKEIRRMNEFSRVALNKEETNELFDDISKAYRMNVNDILETYGDELNG